MDGPAAPAPRVFHTLRSWTESDDLNERHFSGIAEYETSVAIPESWLNKGRRVFVDLGELWAVAEVQLNGREAGTAWKRPFRVEITSAARAGENRLLVRVANNWVNRLAGDPRSPERPRTTKTNVVNTGVNPTTPWRETPLRASGLFGPVRLELERSGSN
jgi:hypothetical protein